MPDSSAPEPVLTHLVGIIRHGTELATKPALTVMGANLWVRKARAVLGQIYGKNSSETDVWCPTFASDADRSPQEKVIQRLQRLENLVQRLNTPATQRIFVGHGCSTEWLKLQTFLSRDLRLQCDEFNAEPTAGMQTASRIDAMLSSASMAFLVLTGDDVHQDGTIHPRQNVAHEVGLFQSRLGPRRAIPMLEHGCSRFSNLDGLTTIDFPQGDIMARAEEVRRVLVREGHL